MFGEGIINLGLDNTQNCSWLSLSILDLLNHHVSEFLVWYLPIWVWINLLNQLLPNWISNLRVLAKNSFYFIRWYWPASILLIKFDYTLSNNLKAIYNLSYSIRDSLFIVAKTNSKIQSKCTRVINGSGLIFIYCIHYPIHLLLCIRFIKDFLVSNNEFFST